MSGKTTNPLSRYFGEMEKKPLRKGELKNIFDQLAERSPDHAKRSYVKKQDQNIAAKEPLIAH